MLLLHSSKGASFNQLFFTSVELVFIVCHVMIADFSSVRKRMLTWTVLTTPSYEIILQSIPRNNQEPR